MGRPACQKECAEKQRSAARKQHVDILGSFAAGPARPALPFRQFADAITVLADVAEKLRLSCATLNAAHTAF
jgi:hypothetical protein